MSKKRDLFLDSVSRLDDGVIERTAKKRFFLWSKWKARQRKRRNLFIGVGAVAACLAILCPVILLLLRPDEPTSSLPPPPPPVINGQVPIYTGMTVSSEYVATAGLPAYGFPASMARGNGNGNNGNHFGNDKKPIGDAASEELGVTPSVQDKYYTAPNSDIYITVHFDNPDEFEILSFRLNGVKYAVQQFLPGSDLENLIIKLNVGDVEGMVSYKITEIKYVDGESITERDVEMRGDDTIKVYVSYRTQPAAAVSGEAVGFDSLSFGVNLTDPNALIAAVTGEIWAVLYDGDAILDKKQITLGENVVTFDGLATGKLYQYAVVATYDAYDGEGIALHVLWEQMVSTEIPVSFGAVSLVGDTAQFELLWHEDFAEKALTSLALYCNGEKVRDLAPDAVSVDGLEAERSYELIATYLIGGVEEKITTSFSVGGWVTVTFVTNGGEEMEPMQLIGGSKLPDAVRQGYTFGGWCQIYHYPNCETVVPAYDVTLYALWEEENNDLDFVDFGEHGIEARVIAREWLTPTERLHIPAYVWGKPVLSVTVSSGGIPGEPIADLGIVREVILPDTVTCVAHLRELYNAVEERDGAQYVAGWIVGFGQSTDSVVIRKGTIGLDFESVQSLPEIKHLTLQTIPAYLDPYSIGDLAEYCTTVTIGEGITHIDDSAFSGCTSLTSITIPESVTSIGSSAFEGCTSLTSITISDGVTHIGDRAFWGCTALVSVMFPDTMAELWSDVVIGSQAFANCTSLTSITIPDGVNFIFDGAFENCTALVSVTLPGTLARIGMSAFAYCTDLVSVTFSDTMTELWYNVDIRSQAFAGCTSLESITIPDSVTRIGNSAFSGCSSLTSITIPDSVRYIGMDAFYDTNLIDTENGVSYVDKWVVDCDTSVINVTLRANTVGIAGAAFRNCESLTSITVSDNVTSIGFRAFSGCSNLTSITLPDTLTSIEAYAFSGCFYLMNVYYGGTASEWSNVTFDGGNEPLVEYATIYYYSESPTVEEGNYWHYVGGVPTAW